PFRRGDALVPATWLETNTGDGCLALPVTDLAAYLRLFLNRGYVMEPQVLTEENFGLMTAHVINVSWAEPGGYYGYAIATHEIDGRAVIGHRGGMVGYATDMKGDVNAGVGAVAMVNGIGDPSEFTTYALRLLQTSVLGGDLPDAPASNDPEHVQNAADYAGVYRSEGQEVKLTASGQFLRLETDGGPVRLETRGEDRFHIPRPGFNRFLFSFSRNEQGEVIQASHGSDWHINERYEGLTAIDHPDAWGAYTGHYRSHNPWLTNLRVVLRAGQLMLVYSGGDEGMLCPLDDGVFAAPEGGPERVRFDTVVDGKALRLNYSGNDFYRFFTK
ncbi:MAG: serine hydrolase, partial [Chloroflexia bacterium]|nr:serine hydrolase [Chloroflexia bacterium]